MWLSSRATTRRDTPPTLRTLPGVVAAGDSRNETEQLMREAMVEHVSALREMGEPVPEPAIAADVTVLDISAA